MRDYTQNEADEKPVLLSNRGCQSGFVEDIDMTFRAFSKNLSSEIENLFATLGNNNLPEDVQRLDQTVNFDDLMQRIKNLDAAFDGAQKKTKTPE